MITLSSLSEKSREFRDKSMHAYARWRVGATLQECRAYNSTDSILLSFDDFADEETVRGFLEVLSGEKVKAAFFLLGEWAKQNPQIVEMIRREGHWVGNHTYSHRNLVRLSSKETVQEIEGGVKGQLLRPPYGIYNNRVRKDAAEIGYRIAYWTIDSDDWRGFSAFEIQKRVLRELHPGACILLHLNGPHTLEALPGLIKGIRERGFELCSNGDEISS